MRRRLLVRRTERRGVSRSRGGLSESASGGAKERAYEPRIQETFSGKVVNKASDPQHGNGRVSPLRVGVLIDNYCEEETFEEDFELVKRRLRENFVHGAEAERIRSYIRENRGHTIIANLEVRLVETQDKYWGSIGAINERFVNVPEGLVKQYPMLLAGGMWARSSLPTTKRRSTTRRSAVHGRRLHPFQISLSTSGIC